MNEIMKRTHPQSVIEPFESAVICSGKILQIQAIDPCEVNTHWWARLYIIEYIPDGVDVSDVEEEKLASEHDLMVSLQQTQAQLLELVMILKDELDSNKKCHEETKEPIPRPDLCEHMQEYINNSGYCSIYLENVEKERCETCDLCPYM